MRLSRIIIFHLHGVGLCSFEQCLGRGFNQASGVSGLADAESTLEAVGLDSDAKARTETRLTHGIVLQKALRSHRS
jgi:hypothetical protein